LACFLIARKKKRSTEREFSSMNKRDRFEEQRCLTC
jgi:hypothetical protein